MVNFIRICLVFLNIFAILVSSSDSAENENHYPFVKIGSKYYFINAYLKMNWFAASYYCRSYGGELAHIESPEELEALQIYIFSQNISKQFWIDGNDLATEGTFMSHTTGRPLIYTNWLENNPSNSNNEDCIELYLYDKKLLMNDIKCDDELLALCQYRAPTMYGNAKISLMNSSENCMLKNLAEALTQAADICNSCSQHALQPTA
ncbi:C-type lectin 37Db-like [Zeugodacus cucurbitae]|uniref:C-type lectin 37Db-like n=1 Tax=Zeugodacus cucurbitae TaxID=28588 RepID=UPI000596A4B3|nr:C-type lectin 37Db-like [Zeugodacus cucurbitae]